MRRSPPPHVQRLVDRLRQALPVEALVRPEFVASSQAHVAVETRSLPCVVTQVYYVDEEKGPLCQIRLRSDASESNVFVLPIARLSFRCERPIARELALYRKHRLESLAEKRRAARVARRAASRAVSV